MGTERKSISFLVMLTLISCWMETTLEDSPLYDELALDNHAFDCGNTCTVGTREDLNRNCYCDQTCAQFDDCCFNSKYRGMNVINENFECLKLNIDDNMGVIIKSKCLENWVGLESIRKQCEWEDYQKYRENANSQSLITDRKTNITYKNDFCYQCNNGSENRSVWEIRIRCERSDGMDLPINGSELTDCILKPVAPDDIIKNVRHCTTDVVSTCSVNGEKYEEICHSYQALVLDKDFVKYRNIHCAWCNGKTNLSEVSCSAPDNVDRKKKMASSENPATTSSYFQLAINYTLKDIDIGEEYTLHKMVLNNSTNLNFPKVIFLKCKYKLFSNDSSISGYSIRDKPEKDFLKNDTIIVCKINTIEKKTTTTLEELLKLKSAAIICSIALITLFCIQNFKHRVWRLLIGSLSVSAFFLHAIFILSHPFQNYFSTCLGLDIAAYYFYLAYFCWMAIIAHQIQFEIMNECSNNNVDEYEINAIIMSTMHYACVWSFPIVLTILVICCNLPINEYFIILIGNPLCWMSETSGLLLLSTFPACLAIKVFWHFSYSFISIIRFIRLHHTDILETEDIEPAVTKNTVSNQRDCLLRMLILSVTLGLLACEVNDKILTGLCFFNNIIMCFLLGFLYAPSAQNVRINTRLPN